MSVFIAPGEVDPQEWETRFDPEKRWWVPYTNQLEVVRGLFKLPPRVTIFEQSLREGAMAPGRRDLTVGDRVRLLAALEAAGVTEAEVGAYSTGPKVERDALREAKRQGIRVVMGMHSAGWAQDLRAEIYQLAEAGVDLLNLLQYGCSHELASTPWQSEKNLAERCAQDVAYAKELGMKVSFGMTSSGRMHPRLEEQCYQAAAVAGADRIYLYDGFGVMIPEVVSYCLRRLRDNVGPGPELAFHGHNDMGLGTANLVAAVQAGATVVDASINGLGNRAGIASLDEVVVVLTALYGVETGIDMQHLTSLSGLVEELYGIPVGLNKAVTGRNLYWHESDIHNAHIIAGHWYSWNVIKPEAIGRKNVINVVPQSLHKQPHGTVATKIRTMGLKSNDAQFDEILNRLRQEMARGERPAVSEDDLERVIREVAAK